MASTMADPASYQYDCPVCAESIAVNEAMREALIEHGCVSCGSALTDEAFSSRRA